MTWSVERLADSVRDQVDDTRPPRSSAPPVAIAAALFIPFRTGVAELRAVGVYLLLAPPGSRRRS